jgi:hypothetical protein
VSAASIAFGTDPNDPNGLVNCGLAGPAHDFAVSNLGNQAFRITSLALGLGASSPFALAGSGAALPAMVPIGGSVTITVTPAAIPGTVADPKDASAFTDTLTITTDAALDNPHTVRLVMQARGAVIGDTPPPTAWSFGTVPFGSIGTYNTSIKNTGNAGASIALQGLAQPSIFGLKNNPTAAVGDAVTAIVGQFTPPASDGAWSDQGTLVVTPEQVFCEPLPAGWNNPTVSLSGASNSNPRVTVAGSLAFPNSNCGEGAPSAQAVTLGNPTNVSYAYAVRLASGNFYTLADPNAGHLPAHGSATIAVTPNAIRPGPGVVPGSAPYADDLLIDVSTTPVTNLTIPISWTLDGAVLSLPQGAGPMTDGQGRGFYPADSTSAFPLPMANRGTATAAVGFGIEPLGSFTFSPMPPVHVLPGVGAAPALSSTSSDSTCPAATLGTATFLYSGPVCQPFPVPAVNVGSCVGTF